MNQKELEKLIEAQEKRVRLEQNELWELQQSLLPFTVAEKSKDIGRCFKCRNNCSCPENDADYWWTYYRIVEVNKDGYYICVYFQTDKYGRIEASKESRTYISDGWVEINEYAYNLAVSKHIADTQNLLK